MIIKQTALGQLFPPKSLLKVTDYALCKYEILFCYFVPRCFFFFFTVQRKLFSEGHSNLLFFYLSYSNFLSNFLCAFITVFCIMHSLLCILQIIFFTCTKKGKNVWYSVLNIQYMKHIFCCILTLKLYPSRFKYR